VEPAPPIASAAPDSAAEETPPAAEQQLGEAAALPEESVPLAAAADLPTEAGESGPPPVPTEPGESAPSKSRLSPLTAGTLVAGRYLLVEALDVQDATIRYLARDRCSCWQCGFAGNAPDDAFCAQCGASLAGARATASLLQVLDPQAEPPAGEQVSARASDGDLHFLVLAEPPRAAAHPGQAQASFRLVTGQCSDPGRERDLNEDSLLAMTLVGTTLRTPPDAGGGLPLLLGLFAVADGMGGHEGGEVASKLALQVLGREVVSAFWMAALRPDGQVPPDPAAALARAVEATNDALYLARQKRETDMGTTLTAALIWEDRLFLAHVGDCRAFRWNADGLAQLTSDHSLVASMVASGRVEPDAVYTHPQRSVVYRSIGDRSLVEVDTAELALAPGDRLVLCSDGLWEMIRNEGIEDVLMQEADPQLACSLLVSRANAAGGADNISVIVVQVASA
jgi:serine/threonine protein phosphatase PrpC